MGARNGNWLRKQHHRIGDGWCRWGGCDVRVSRHLMPYVTKRERFRCDIVFNLEWKRNNKAHSLRSIWRKSSISANSSASRVFSLERRTHTIHILFYSKNIFIASRTCQPFDNVIRLVGKRRYLFFVGKLWARRTCDCQWFEVNGFFFILQ